MLVSNIAVCGLDIGETQTVVCIMYMPALLPAFGVLGRHA